MHELYDCKCPDCGGHIERLSLSNTENNDLQKAFNRSARWVYDKKKTEILPDDLTNKSVQPLMDTINSALQDGFNKGIAHTVPYVMQRGLSESIYIFSGAKTYAELKQLSGLLLDAEGKIKPFNTFWQETRAIHSDYNRNYLEAEYIFATQSAQMASKWNEFEKYGDRYNLQYRTANDHAVRESHRLLHNITLPPSDPFWERFFPPNGWRCRCTVSQVLHKDYEVSDSQHAQSLGEKATYTEGKNGQNTAAIFRFNPGKDNVIFPAHHPYMKSLNNQEKEVISKIVSKAGSITTKEDVVAVISKIDQEKGWFERGANSLEVTKRKDANGATDMNGKIWLKTDRMNNTITGIDKLTRNEAITFDEADALATYWHEVTHNRNKPGNMLLTNLQRRYMELANEYVSRNTLPEFYEALGADMQHPELVTDRKSTGYNRMVKNYAKIAEKTKMDTGTVVELVKDHLFSQSYTDQKSGLTNALNGAKKADGTKLKKAEINSLVKQCYQLSESRFDEYLNDLIR